MLEITPTNELRGKVSISGAKNAILPIMAASLLTDEKVFLSSVPFLQDVNNMCSLIKNFGCNISENRDEDILELQTGAVKSSETQYELVNKMRASVLVMGPMLSRCGEVKVWMPGGCQIGSRPVDLHLKGLSQMGATIENEHGCIIARVTNSSRRKLQGAHIYLDFPSVGATENILMAAVLAEGETTITNAAQEPEIVDLANFINSMGGKVEGAGTDTIKIKGVSKLWGTEYTVIPDRIEAGTFMVAAAIVEGDVIIENVISAHIKSTIAKLKEMGVVIEELDNALRVRGKNFRKAIDVKTLPYPGFPTDMQAQFMSALATADGTGIITETVFENRFMHVDELKKMGANIKTEGRVSIVEGISSLEGARVKATDLRAGAALIIAALKANGKTIIEDEYHIDRGYYRLQEKFKNLGVTISKI